MIPMTKDRKATSLISKNLVSRHQDDSHSETVGLKSSIRCDKTMQSCSFLGKVGLLISALVAVAIVAASKNNLNRVVPKMSILSLADSYDKSVYVMKLYSIWAALMGYLQSKHTVDIQHYIAVLRNMYGYFVVDFIAWGVVLSVIFILVSVGCHQLIFNTTKMACNDMSITENDVEELEFESGTDTEDEDATSQSSINSNVSNCTMDHSPTDEDQSDKFVSPDIIYVDKKLTLEEYEKEAEEATRTELIKLLKSKELRQMVKDRGGGASAFNWQRRRSSRLQEKAAAENNSTLNAKSL